MKIVGGRWRGRNITAPPTKDVRPTNVRVRQSLFNILRHGRFGDQITNAIVLDAFAGTGALGLDALSQGATHATFLDTSRAARTALEANIKSLDATAATVLSFDATNPPPRPTNQDPATLVFIDPPYGKNLAAPAVTALDTAGWFTPDVLVVIESAHDELLPPIPSFTVADNRTISPAALTFLERD